MTRHHPTTATTAGRVAAGVTAEFLLDLSRRSARAAGDDRRGPSRRRAPGRPAPRPRARRLRPARPRDDRRVGDTTAPPSTPARSRDVRGAGPRPALPSGPSGSDPASEGVCEGHKTTVMIAPGRSARVGSAALDSGPGAPCPTPATRSSSTPSPSATGRATARRPPVPPCVTRRSTSPRASSSRCSGPSGCGKSTTLRMLAGFERPDRGRIHLRGRTSPTFRRRAATVNMVFQAYALFPHMSVAQNVAFGPRMRRIKRAELARARATRRCGSCGSRRSTSAARRSSPAASSSASRSPARSSTGRGAAPRRAARRPGPQAPPQMQSELKAIQASTGRRSSTSRTTRTRR